MTPTKRRRAFVVIEGGKKKPEPLPLELLDPFYFWLKCMASLNDTLIGFNKP
jgi:hypothetical protein